MRGLFVRGWFISLTSADLSNTGDHVAGDGDLERGLGGAGRDADGEDADLFIRQPLVEHHGELRGRGA